MNGRIAVALAERGAEMQHLIFDLRQHCDRGVAIAIQGRDDGPLGFDGSASKGVVKLRENFQGVSVSSPALKGQSPLTGRGQQYVRGNWVHDRVIEKAGAFQP